MTAMCKNMMKRTGAHGATSAIHCSAIAVGKSTAISKIVDFIGAEPFGSALFLPSPRVILSGSHRVILSGAKDLAFID
ncbi:MAG: hypothetical protein MJY93_09035 [Fibrobacter sp.]|nr:hypothetical protein [Fibrobacter sp.]